MKDKIGQDIELGDLVVVAYGSQGASLAMGFVDGLTAQRVYVVEPTSREERKPFDMANNRFVNRADYTRNRDFEWRVTGNRLLSRNYYQQVSERIVKIDPASLKRFNIDSFVADWLREEHGKVIKHEFISQV